MALPIDSLVSYTAQAVLDQINAQGGNCSEVDRWLNGGWDAHINSLPFNDFAVELGKGYFLKCVASSQWTFDGHAVTAGVPLALQPGWNLVGVPFPPAGYTAQSLLDAIAGQGGACSEVDRWLNGGWDAHINTLPFNNFVVEPEQGLLRQVQPGQHVRALLGDGVERPLIPGPGETTRRSLCSEDDRLLLGSCLCWF